MNLPHRDKVIHGRTHRKWFLPQDWEGGLKANEPATLAHTPLNQLPGQWRARARARVGVCVCARAYSLVTEQQGISVALCQHAIERINATKGMEINRATS